MKSSLHFKSPAEGADSPRTQASRVVDVMESLYGDGFYPGVAVTRSWSVHNPVIRGEVARPDAIRWFLVRDIEKLLAKGADIEVFPSRKRIELSNPAILNSIDEEDWDIRQKKLFLFTPERIELSMDRIEHYTGCDASVFQRYLIFTNYDMHIEMFRKRFSDCTGPCREGVQMPAYHSPIEDNLGCEHYQYRRGALKRQDSHGPSGRAPPGRHDNGGALRGPAESPGNR